MIKTILYGCGCKRSAIIIGEHFGLPVKRIPDQDDEVIFRWGTSRYATEGENEAINSRRSVYNASNKLLAFRLLAENGIAVPKVWPELTDDVTFPCLSRTITHRQGRDIRIIETPDEVEVEAGRYFVELLSIKDEYRVHVLNNEPVRLFRKIPGDNANDLIRSARCGWVFYRVRPQAWLNPVLDKAVMAASALGLYFTALDIVHTTDHRFVVLEANTAPGIYDNSNVRDLYLASIGGWLEENYGIKME